VVDDDLGVVVVVGLPGDQLELERRVRGRRQPVVRIDAGGTELCEFDGRQRCLARLDHVQAAGHQDARRRRSVA
jgi:hypothetical protein